MAGRAEGERDGRGWTCRWEVTSALSSSAEAQGAARLPGIWSDCRVRRLPYSNDEGLKTPSTEADDRGGEQRSF